MAKAELDNAVKDLYVLLESSLLGSTQDRGIGSIIDSTGTYAGLAQGTYSAWASAETAVSGAMTAAVMQDAHETLRAAPYNSMASAILLPPNQVTNYTAVMGPAASSTPARMTIPTDGATPHDFGMLRVPPQFNGIPLISVNGITATEVYWLPASLCAIRPRRLVVPSWVRVKNACSTASRTRSVRMCVANCQPTTRREKTSMTKLKNTIRPWQRT